MKSTTQYLLAAFVIVSLFVLGAYMINETNAQSTSLNIPSNNTPVVSNANFSLMCGVVQDQTGTERQKIILLDNRTGQCKSLEQDPTAQKFQWEIIK